MSDLEQKFKENLEGWREHCHKNILSSCCNPDDYINCDAFRNIVSMGKDVLPLIRKAYDTELNYEQDIDSLRYDLHYAVLEIVKGKLEFPNTVEDLEQMSEYTIKWLDEYLGKDKTE
jgi:hypothetical protein